MMTQHQCLGLTNITLKCIYNYKKPKTEACFTPDQIPESIHVTMFLFFVPLTCFRVAEIIDAQQLVVSSCQQTVTVLRGEAEVF